MRAGQTSSRGGWPTTSLPDCTRRRGSGVSGRRARATDEQQRRRAWSTAAHRTGAGVAPPPAAGFLEVFLAERSASSCLWRATETASGSRLAAARPATFPARIWARCGPREQLADGGVRDPGSRSVVNGLQISRWWRPDFVVAAPSRRTATALARSRDSGSGRPAASSGFYAHESCKWKRSSKFWNRMEKHHFRCLFLISYM